MNDRLASTRPAPWWACRSNLARLVLAVSLFSPAAIISSGCRSGGESDLVTRELRMQEDQLYAMEDYLTQYQQLLRKCRAENAELKHELNERGEELPEPPLRSRRPSSQRSSPGRTAPDLGPPTRRETEASPPTSPENIELPDIPPLEESTQSESEPHVLAASAVFDQDSMDQFEANIPEIEAAAQPESVTDEQEASMATHEASESPDIPTRILLHGEIVANEAGGGPRLVVDVVPRSGTGGAASFVGDLSLMVLAPGDSGQPQSLARWDFSSDDAQAAAEESDDGRAMRFYLELPGDASAAAPVQLWARALPADGEKLLAYADIDFQQAGRFSSVVEPHVLHGIAVEEAAPVPIEQQVSIEQGDRSQAKENPVQVVHRERVEPRRTIPVDVNDGTWNVARPGEPEKLAEGNKESGGSWRMASEPLPSVAISNTRKERSHRPPRSYPTATRVEQASYADVAKPSRPRRFEVPTWTPERTGRSTRTAAVPSWSPNR